VTTAESVESVAAGVLGSDLESVLGWLAVRATGSQIGRSRRGATSPSASAAVADAVAAPDVSATQPFAEDEVLVVLESGKVVRSSVNEVPAKGRDTMGVVFARFEDTDKILAVARNSERNLVSQDEPGEEAEEPAVVEEDVNE
jgi:hypothetical protein